MELLDEKKLCDRLAWGWEWFRRAIWWALTNGICRWEPLGEGGISVEAQYILLLGAEGGVLCCCCCCCDLGRRWSRTVYKQFIMFGEFFFSSSVVRS